MMDCLSASFTFKESLIEKLITKSFGEELGLTVTDIETQICYGYVTFCSQFNSKFSIDNISADPNSGIQMVRKRANHVPKNNTVMNQSKRTFVSKPMNAVQSYQPVIKTQGSVIFGKDELGNLICPICKKSFTAQASADRHFTTVHNKISFKCEMCDYACRKDYLKVHAMKSHGINEAMARLMVQNCKQIQQ